MPSLSVNPASQIFTMPFRRHRQSYTINPPEEVHNVIYLGNVVSSSRMLQQ